MSKYKNTGIIYIHIGMNEWVKCYTWEFPHKTKKEENEKNVTHKELERLVGVLLVCKVGLIRSVTAMAVTWKSYCLFLPSSIMSQSILCNCFKVCMKFLLERERESRERLRGLLKNKRHCVMNHRNKTVKNCRHIWLNKIAWVPLEWLLQTRKLK